MIGISDFLYVVPISVFAVGAIMVFKYFIGHDDTETRKRIVEDLVNLHHLTNGSVDAEAIIEDLACYYGVYQEYCE